MIHTDPSTADRTLCWTRRRFLNALLAAGGAGLSGARLPRAAAQEPARPGGGAGGTAPFSFLALGDVHFDRLEDHDHDWLNQEHPRDVPQVANYSRITREITPRLFDVLRTLAGEPASAAPVRLVAQLGDLVEGMCGSEALARGQCEGVVRLVREAKLGVPFLAAKGNHEVQGPGAVAAYNATLLPFLARESGQSLDGQAASLAYECGDALFVFLDVYDRRHDHRAWLKQTLARRSARHLFVLLHPPLVPFGARSLWHLDAAPERAAARAERLDLLGRHRAIVLCAHLHRQGVVVRTTPNGRFVQVALCSVVPSPKVEARDVVTGTEHYGPDLVRLEPKFSPDTLAARRAALSAEAPFIQYFEHADAPGFARVVVDGATVRADFHLGLDRRPWKSIDLSAMLQG